MFHKQDRNANLDLHQSYNLCSGFLNGLLAASVELAVPNPAAVVAVVAVVEQAMPVVAAEQAMPVAAVEQAMPVAVVAD